MLKNVTKNLTKNLILALGSTKEEIAKTLIAQGFRGKLHTNQEDVVGRYLKQVGGYNWEWFEWVRKNYEPALHFVRAYDQQQWPELLQ